MRFTPVARIASSSVCVSRVPLSKSISGSLAAFAMSEFAARCTTASWPLTASVSARTSEASPATIDRSGEPIRGPKCSRRPVRKLSKTVTGAKTTIEDRVDQVGAKEPRAAGNEETRLRHGPSSAPISSDGLSRRSADRASQRRGHSHVDTALQLRGRQRPAWPTALLRYGFSAPCRRAAYNQTAPATPPARAPRPSPPRSGPGRDRRAAARETK